MTTKTVDSEANGASLSLLDNMPESAIYEYDQNNKLKKVTTADTIAAYSYLPDGRRASKTVNGVKTSHIWDGNNIVADTKNGILTKYIRSNKLEQAVTGDNIQNYTVDSRGDVIDFGNTDYFYDAFGNVQTETNPNPFGYCGEYFDQETGFIYLRNRYYDPTIGRFITEDPARDQLNWYTYCDNNPIMFVDPSGLYKLEKGTNGTVYAVIESGDTLSGIAKSEVNNASAYRKMNYSGNPNSIWVGQKINITGIYNKNYPNPFIRYPNTSISTAYNDDNDSGYMLDKETTVALTAILTPLARYSLILIAPEVFPENPYDFNPKGLERRIYDTKNGKVFKWLDKNKKAIYEWDEELKYGSPHYHYIGEDGNVRIPGKNGNKHLFPGDIVPK